MQLPYTGVADQACTIRRVLQKQSASNSPLTQSLTEHLHLGFTHKQMHGVQMLQLQTVGTPS